LRANFETNGAKGSCHWVCLWSSLWNDISDCGVEQKQKKEEEEKPAQIFLFFYATKTSIGHPENENASSVKPSERQCVASVLRNHSQRRPSGVVQVSVCFFFFFFFLVYFFFSKMFPSKTHSEKILLPHSRGCVPPLLGASVLRSVQFGVFEMTFAFLKKYEIPSFPIFSVNSNIYLAGMAAGAGRAIIECPLEVARPFL
jgi:hypothetical protein